MTDNPFKAGRFKTKLSSSSSKVRPNGSTCPVPLMLDASDNNLVICGRSSLIACCGYSQGSPFLKCCGYFQNFLTDKEKKDYFHAVETQTDVNFLETQKMLSSYLFQKMVESQTKSSGASHERNAKQLAQSTSEVLNNVSPHFKNPSDY